MTYKLKIGTTLFHIYVKPLGGAVSIFKNEDHYWDGQWFKYDKKLLLANFPFVEIHRKIEKLLQDNLNNEDIVFPYIEGYSKCT